MNPIQALLTISAKWIHMLGALAAVGMVSGTGTFVYLHLQSNSQKTNIAQANFSASIGELDKQSMIGLQLRSQIEQLRLRVENIPDLQDASEYNRRSAEIASTAEDAGIRIDQLQPEEQQVLGRVSWVPIMCVGVGTMDALTLWIDELEKNQPDIVVQSLDIESNDLGRMLQLRVLFRWYVLVD